MDLRLGVAAEHAARPLRVLRAGRAIGVFQPGENRDQQGTHRFEASGIRRRNAANDRDVSDIGRANFRGLVIRPPVHRLRWRGGNRVASGAGAAVTFSRIRHPGTRAGLGDSSGAGTRWSSIHL